MTWSLHFDGDASAAWVGNVPELSTLEKQFSDAQDIARRNHLPELEIVDIGDTLNLVRAVSVKYGRVTGDASGHWINFGKDDPRTRFGALTVSVRLVEVPDGNPLAGRQFTESQEKHSGLPPCTREHWGDELPLDLIEQLHDEWHQKNPDEMYGSVCKFRVTRMEIPPRP